MKMAGSSNQYNFSASKVERKIVEKNRRNHMKTLYSQLFSLLPDPCSKELLPLPDQIDEAINFIKTLEMKVEKSKEKKQTLLSSSGRKPSHACSSSESVCALKSPQIEVRQMGSALDIVVISGQDCNFRFSEIIRVVQEEGAVIVNANSSVKGETVFHAIHAKIGDFMPGFPAEQVSNKLKQLIHGSTSDLETQQPLWKLEIQPDLWDQFEIQAASAPMGLNPLSFDVLDPIMF